ncbi:MAG: putative baseplate assembly protein, partial [Nostoc sp.]
FGDPYQSLQIDMRELMLLIISANVRILANYQWSFVAQEIRTALFDKFSFENQELGENVVLSGVISTIQQVPGVDYVDVDILDSVSETEAQSPGILNTKLQELAKVGSTGGNGQPKQWIPVNLAVFDSTINQLFPAQLAILNTKVPDTLILKELKS